MVLAFLQGSPESFFGRREIARKAVRRQVFEQNPHWADAPITSLLAKGMIEQSNNSLYRIKKDELLP